MTTPTASRHSVTGLVLMLAGSIAVALGFFFIISSIVSAITEDWGGHASGLSLLVYGLVLALPGVMAVQQGFRMHRATSKEH